MNNDFRATTPMLRATAAAAAAIAAILVTGSMNALAIHYDRQALSTPVGPAMVASR